MPVLSNRNIDDSSIFLMKGIPFVFIIFENDEIPDHLKPAKEGLEAHAS